MKAVNRKTLAHRYRVHDGSRLSFQGRWYTCPWLLNRLQGKEFELYYDGRDVRTLYLFVDGHCVGDAYCPAFRWRRVSYGEATSQPHAETEKVNVTATPS